MEKADPALHGKPLPDGRGFALGSESPQPRRFHPVAVGLAFPGVPGPVAVLTRCATVPSPPLLDPSADEHSHAVLLARWYVGAAESRFKGKCYLFARHPVERSKHYALLKRAAQVFIERNIPPAAWCAFSCDVWREYGGNKKPPLVSWVFSPKRIENRRGWFRAESGDYTGGLVVMTPAARDLLDLQHRMRLTIARENPSPDRLARIVRHYFPGDRFAELVSQVDEEARAVAADFDRRMKEGRWLW